MTRRWSSFTFIGLLVTLLLFGACVVYGQDNPAEELADAAAFPVTNDNDLTTSSTVKAYDDFTTTTTAGQQQLQVQSEDDLTDLEQSLLISLLMIIVSEIGDKTFLIAAIMAMKHSRFVVFSAAFSSLVLMSVLSAFLGHVVPNLIPKAYTDVLAAILFFSFGIRMLWEGSHMSPDDENEEMTEVEEELREAEEGQHHTVKKMEVGGLEIEPEEEHRSRKSKTRQLKEGLMNLMQLVFSPVFVQTFVLTFLGEWGDRSQISTIALAAANNVYWVTTGVIVGHTMCTALAVIGGRMLAAKISVRTVTLSGAILFLVFGIYYTYHAYQGQLE